MAQSATTATHVSPTPPTNMANAFGGSPPTTDGLAAVDDGAIAEPTLLKAANSGAAHEGAGTEVVVTPVHTVPATYPLKTVSVLGNFTSQPNQQHASSLSPATNPALASIAPPSVASGAGTQLLTATGTNFTKQSVIVVNGVPQVTTFVSATSLTATVTKKTTAGTWPVYVLTGGVVNTATLNWTFT